MKTPEQIRELIATIPVNDLNLKHIGTSGKINGSLHAELYDRFYRYEARISELELRLRNLIYTVDACDFEGEIRMSVRYDEAVHALPPTQ